MYNTKNYTEQGGDVTHIGGKLIIEQGAEVEGMSGVAYTAGDNITIEGNEISATDTTYEAATESELGLVKQAAAHFTTNKTAYIHLEFHYLNYGKKVFLL